MDSRDAAALALQTGKAGLFIKVGAVLLALLLIALVVLGAIVGGGTARQNADACLAATGADGSVPLPAGDPDAPVDVKVASWNVLKSNSPSRVLAGIEALGAAGADVVGLQELTPRLRAALARNLGSQWEISKGNNAVQIIWRRDRVTAIAQDSAEVFGVTRLRGGGNGVNGSSAGPKHFQWVQFRTAGGGTFAVINHHLLPSIETKGHPDKRATQEVKLAGRQMAAALAQTDRFQAAGIPATITGDHNVAALADSKVKDARFPYVLYAKHGVYSSWRVLGYPKTGTHGKRLIDYVFSTTKLLAPTRQQILKAHGSDHKGVLVTLSNKSRGSTRLNVDLTTVPKATGTEREQQVQNARYVEQGVRQAGGDGRAVYLALVAAVGESDLININYGDNAGPDSRGLFQQRLNWGTLTQRMNPVWAAGAFMLGPHQQGSGGLLDLPGWRDLAPTTAIHRVQNNRDPNHYTAFEARAREIASEAGIALDAPAGPADVVTNAAGAADSSCPAGTSDELSGSCAPTQMAGETQGLTPDALLVLRCVAGHFSQVQSIGTYPGHQPDMSRAVDIMIPGDYQSPAGQALGQSIAEWLQQSASQLGIDYVIWREHIWSTQRAREGWRQCGTAAATCYAGDDDSAAHRDHVHVSVFGNRGTGFGAGAEPVGSGACPVDTQVALSARPGNDCNAALAFLEQQMTNPSKSWYRRCLELVMKAYGYSGGADTAYEAGRDAEARGQLSTDRTNIPRGAVLYWDGHATGNPAGHVAIADGRGYIYSNDVKTPGKVDRVPQDFPEKQWGQRWMGWTGPYFPQGVGGSS